MKTLTWEKISALAEIISSVAILATLGYLAVQTRQNTVAVQSNSRQEILNAEIGLLYELMERPYVVEQWRSATTSDDIPADQRIQVDLAGTAYLRIRENLFLQFRNGVIDQDTWRTYRDIFVSTLVDSKYLRQQWEQFGDRNQFVEGFYEEIDGALHSGSAVGGSLLEAAEN
jgi:hypothetical protein